MMRPVHRPDPGGGSALPAGLILAPVIPYSSEGQQPVPATPAPGGYPHPAASSGREQGRADSSHPQGAPHPRLIERSRADRGRTSAARALVAQWSTHGREYGATASGHALDKPGANSRAQSAALRLRSVAAMSWSQALGSQSVAVMSRSQALGSPGTPGEALTYARNVPHRGTTRTRPSSARMRSTRVTVALLTS